MHLFLKIPPTEEPLTLQEVEDYLKLPSNQDEAFVKTLIAAARSYIENVTGRALLKQKWELHITPPYPPSSPLVKRRGKELEIELPRPPLLHVEAVKAAQKEVSFTIKDGKVCLPSSFWDQELVLTYWAGYGDTALSLPPALKMASLMAARFIYDNQTGELALLAPFKVHRLI